ncbi:MAG TPA: fibronectin type III domain-containing protein [Bryobacteraceae bacterium]|nr:fibronectin type III domain-containing protein [Bryobacteraceae bacterium]
MTRIAAIVCALLLCSCAYVGNPQAPTLDLPQTVSDLRVAEYGDHIRTEFTIAAETTEGLPLKSLRLLEMRVGVAPQPWDQNKWAASAKRYTIPFNGSGPIEFDKVPVSEWMGKDVVIGVRATGPKGKSSQWSNVKSLSIEPPLASPANLKIENSRTGLYLTWTSSAKRFRIFRKAPADEMPMQVTDNDTAFAWNEDVAVGATYTFYVQAYQDDFHQSEIAVTLPTTHEDVFAPTVPIGLTAEQGANSIELSWERNTEPRFQGYNVYRSLDNGPFEKIAPLIIAPAYSDTKIESGKKYRYSISAVGINGMESERSAPYEITAP